LSAGRLVGPTGNVIGMDMTDEMIAKARQAAADAGLDHVEFRKGYAESLPVDDGWADVVISNGVVNLCPDKVAVFKEMHRVLKPGGRIQIGDIIVQKAVSEGAKRNIDLWKG
jgi:ubiquinone/menaquinone biosynthesis C-methylase UbiE